MARCVPFAGLKESLALSCACKALKWVEIFPPSFIFPATSALPLNSSLQEVGDIVGKSNVGSLADCCTACAAFDNCYQFHFL